MGMRAARTEGFSLVSANVNDLLGKAARVPGVAARIGPFAGVLGR
jgi:hypothetical protein